MRNWEQWTEETLNVSGIEYCFFEPMRQHTTFRIGGPARVFARPADEQQLRLLLKYCREGDVPCMVLGNGSNLLVSDEGYEGVVISLNKAFSECSISGNCCRNTGNRWRWPGDECRRLWFGDKGYFKKRCCNDA